MLALLKKFGRVGRRRILSIVSLGVVAVLMASTTISVGAAVFDEDYYTGSINGVWWQGYSYVYVDSGSGGWVISGASSTTRNSSLDYAEVRGRGTEDCGGVITDTNWDQSLWGLNISYTVTGSGFSSIGNCSWYLPQPCKAFSSKGTHRSDENGPPWAYGTGQTNAWVLEPVC